MGNKVRWWGVRVKCVSSIYPIVSECKQACTAIMIAGGSKEGDTSQGPLVLLFPNKTILRRTGKELKMTIDQNAVGRHAIKPSRSH